MDLLFERVTIVGAGLLGASLGLALQQRGVARHITGVGRRQVSLDKALAAGTVHEVTLDLNAGVAEADLVVIATPANAVLDALSTIRPACPDSAIVIDVASTKAAVCAHAASLWPAPRRFVGCHPMAGSEKSGPENAQADLYVGSVCLIEDSADLDPGAVRRVQELWERVGARVVPVEPAQHDTILAQTSHVPHILATVLATVAHQDGAARDFVGNGFRDMTRVAAGSPEMWRDITLTNRAAVAAGLEGVKAELDAFLSALRQDDGAALMALFEAGRVARERVLSE